MVTRRSTCCCCVVASSVLYPLCCPLPSIVSVISNYTNDEASYKTAIFYQDDRVRLSLVRLEGPQRQSSVQRQGGIMELSQLEAFLEAVERGSFRRAAEALLLAQPSISARIQRLEDELGVPLFHRMARGVRLTDMGRTFLPFAQRFVESLRRGTEVLESVRHASAGILNRRKWAAPRAVLARPSRSRDISTSPVPAAMASSG